MKKIFLAVLASVLMSSAVFAASSGDGTQVQYLNWTQAEVQCPGIDAGRIKYVSDVKGSQGIGPGYLTGTTSQGVAFESVSHSLPWGGPSKDMVNVRPYQMLNAPYSQQQKFYGYVLHGTTFCSYHYYPYDSDATVNVTMRTA